MELMTADVNSAYPVERSAGNRNSTETSFGNRGIPLTDEAAGFSVIALKPLL